jgi:hypothetical protein
LELNTVLYTNLPVPEFLKTTHIFFGNEDVYQCYHACKFAGTGCFEDDQYPRIFEMHTWLAFNFAAPGRFGNNIIFGNRHINVIMHANLPVPDVFCTLDIWLAFIFAATGGFGNNIMFGNRHISVIMQANLPVPDVFKTVSHLEFWKCESGLH